ncbi:YcjX family protein [Acidocella facilis]|uniref:YcjX family protein n=1 Tax=Acidocella facilis TaxID=525 RepID=UPI001F3C2913|nr:YcjX family protein [Acidocella facilis]
MVLKNILNAGERALDAAKFALEYGEASLNETVIKLAVTGLSRSGKTVFITSMIQNLLALGDQKNTLPELTKRLMQDGQTRLIDVKILAAGAEQIPRFDFKSKLALLESDKPEWPSPTDDLATISLMMTLKRPDSGVNAALKRLGQTDHRIKLEILDYPGEWLLDLPILSQSYGDWARATLDLMRSEPRSQAFEEFIRYTRESITADGKPDEALMRKAHLLYKRGLTECREKHGLQFLQPGRFVCPGPKGADIPFLWFFPIDTEGRTPRAETTAELLARRFESYKEYVRREFFDTYFAEFNRQILLVDVLTALYKGRSIFKDTEMAIEEIAKGLATQKIAKLAVAATKADHVPPRSRDNLASLAEDLTESAFRGRPNKNDIFHAIASIDSTEPTVVTRGDRQVVAVTGKIDGQMRPYDVGEVPSKMPESDYFDYQLFSLPGFEPRRFDPKIQYIKNIGIDKVLDTMVGDSL